MVAQGTIVERVQLIGGGSKSEAVRAIAPSVFGTDIVVPAEAEYVALGAARQAAWVLSGADTPPSWTLAGIRTVSITDADQEATSGLRERYAAARYLTTDRRPLSSVVVSQRN